MERMSREELNKALDSLKKVFEEESYQGDFPRRFACCYSPMSPTYYKWDDMPGEHICPKCGKQFGKGKIAEGERRWKDDKFERHDGDICKWDLYNLVDICREFYKAGYIIEMEMHCSECIEQGSVPILFKLRTSEDDDGVISYPHVEPSKNRLSQKNEELPEKCFFPWQYDIALRFATDPELGKGTKESCREWLDRLRNGRAHYYEGRPWKMVHDTIEGILGIPAEDTSE